MRRAGSFTRRQKQEGARSHLKSGQGASLTVRQEDRGFHSDGQTTKEYEAQEGAHGNNNDARLGPCEGRQDCPQLAGSGGIGQDSYMRREKVGAEMFKFERGYPMMVVRPTDPDGKLAFIDLEPEVDFRIRHGQALANFDHHMVGWLTTDNRIVDRDGFIVGPLKRGDSHYGIAEGELPKDLMPWFMELVIGQPHGLEVNSV